MKKFLRLILLPLIVVRRVIAVLDFPRDIDDFLTYSKGIHDSMAASALFAGLAAKLAALLVNIGKLETAHNGLQTHPPTTTVAQRDTFLLDVQNNLRGLKLDVQTLADADLPEAETIITTAGMKVKRQGAINKQNLMVKDGSISGSAKLMAKGSTASRYANDWGMSQDGTNWIPVTPTLKATTTVSGLVPGSMWDFRHRYILKDGPTDWIEFNDFIVR